MRELERENSDLKNDLAETQDNMEKAASFGSSLLEQVEAFKCATVARR